MRARWRRGGGLTLHCHNQNDFTVNQPMCSRSSCSIVRCKVTRLCPQNHQTVFTKSPDCVHKSPDCVHKVTRLCPQSHQTVTTKSPDYVHKSPDCVHVSPDCVHKVIRLCPQSHQTVSTCHQAESTKSPDCVHKVTRLCPHVTTFCRRGQKAEAESNQGHSDNGPSALPLGQTGLRLKTVPLVHLLNAQLSRSRPVERSQIPRVSHPGYTTRMPPIKIRVAAGAMLMFHSLWAGVDK